VHHYPTYVMTK